MTNNVGTFTIYYPIESANRVVCTSGSSYNIEIDVYSPNGVPFSLYLDTPITGNATLSAKKCISGTYSFQSYAIVLSPPGTTLSYYFPATATCTGGAMMNAVSMVAAVLLALCGLFVL